MPGAFGSRPRSAKSPEELHQLGLEQVARFRKELAELGGKVLGTGDIVEIQRRLRGDAAMHFATAEEVEAKAREALARAKAAMPNWFATLPKADCAVKVMGMHEAPHSTIAYYRQPAMDGSRPGQYMINTYKPETRPRYEAEALAFHESIPGHHLQIAIAQELTGVPEFRKHLGVTAFFEGWGLYSERLAEDMGLYSSDLDRIGMLSYDAWRACRLVVDTGMHALGWSRQQAIDYMVENTVLAENNIVNEVDRYLTWPGQALAYKVGQLEILALREEARKRLGERFDIKRVPRRRARGTARWRCPCFASRSRRGSRRRRRRSEDRSVPALAGWGPRSRSRSSRPITSRNECSLDDPISRYNDTRSSGTLCVPASNSRPCVPRIGKDEP